MQYTFRRWLSWLFVGVIIDEIIDTDRGQEETLVCRTNKTQERNFFFYNDNNNNINLYLWYFFCIFQMLPVSTATGHWSVQSEMARNCQRIWHILNPKTNWKNFHTEVLLHWAWWVIDSFFLFYTYIKSIMCVHTVRR